MKKELIYVGLGIAVSEIGGLVTEKIINKRKKKSNTYDDQIKAYANKLDKGAWIFDNNLKEAVKFTETLINTREFNNKKFEYTPRLERSTRFDLDQMYWAAWGMA